MEKYSKKTPAKKQPEQSADSKVANARKTKSVATKKNDDLKVDKSPKVSEETKRPKRIWPWLILMPIWTYAAFVLAQLVIAGVIIALGKLGVDFAAVNSTVFVTVSTALIFVLALSIAVGVPYRLYKRKTSWKDLGISDYPRWMDILLAVLVFVVYIFVSGIVVLVVSKLSPVPLENNQQLPFSSEMLIMGWQYWLAFLTIVIIVPLAEELLFRGYLYGKLRKISPIWASFLITSLAFGLAHLWSLDGPLQIMVAIDTFVLSLFLCALRENTGAIWAAFLVHAIKNGVAFYLLFVNPSLLKDAQSAIMTLL